MLTVLLVIALTALGCRTEFWASRNSLPPDAGPNETVSRTLTEQRRNRREMVAQDIEAKTAWARALFYNSPTVLSTGDPDTGTATDR